MLLYIKGKENGNLLVDSVLNGPLDYGTVTEGGTATTPAIVRKRRYDELTDAEKLREACDIKATNIVLQGLPQDIYNLERESKLYDEFDMFTLPEWSKFVTDVKLAKDLNNTNFDHLYGYLKQHEAHADEVLLMKERFLNPLALQHYYQAPIANHSLLVHLQSYQPFDVHQPSQASFPLMDSGLVVPSFLPSNDPISSLNKGYEGSGARSNATSTRVNRTRGSNTACQALESRVVLDEEHMAFLADNRDTVTPNQQSQEIPTPAAFQIDDLDAFDSNYDEATSASVVLMAKLSSYDSDILLEQLSAEQAFWLPISKLVFEIPPVKPEPVLKEILCELPIVSLVKDSFNKMRSHVNDFENMVTVCTKSIFHMFDQGLHKDITEMKEVFTQMETEVPKCFVERKTFEIKEKELLVENERLLDLLLSQDLVHTAMNSLAEIIDYQSMENSFLDEYSKCVELKAELSKKKEMVEKDTPEFPAFFEINELKAQLEAKNNSISTLKDHIATLKGKGVSEGDKSANISKVLTLGMYKLDLEPLSPMLLRNREARVDYLKYTQEHADTLREIVERDRSLRPLDSDLDSA
ncbi:hypothetical protein Tco_0561021, partial [Tanacetum coccineum]